MRMRTSLSIMMVIGAFISGLLLVLSHNGVQLNKISMDPSVSATNTTFSIQRRQLLKYGGIKQNKACSNNDIRITQGTRPPQPSGIPTYSVEITNMCPTDCAIKDIKLNCAGFTSANLINPSIFRHLPAPNHDLCIVNDGNPLKAGAIISFEYTTTFMYKSFSVSSVACPV